MYYKYISSEIKSPESIVFTQDPKMHLVRLSNAIPKHNLSRLALKASSTRSLHGVTLVPKNHDLSSSSSSSSITTTTIQKRTLSSDSINYSGGQANTGQGGYYGSGGARAKAEADSTVDITQEQRSKMLAQESDLEMILICMEKLENLENLLRTDQEEHDGEVTDRSVELRGNIKHLVSSPEFSESLDRLEIKGSPVWGLSSVEHDMVCLAREKFNTC